MSVGKFNKKTFLVAVLVALLCFLSITGATYALFTSTLEDGKIGVNATSGNIEVDVVDTTNEENSLLGDALRFFTTSNKQEILFEPGALYYTEGFRVKNTGDIALNYILHNTSCRYDSNFAGIIDTVFISNLYITYNLPIYSADPTVHY